jgi:adenylate kinase family enzyme
MNCGMKVINLFGGPGLGKSTIAAGLYHEMKKRHYEVEFVTEYVKELVFNKEFFKIKDQLYILAKQNHRQLKLEDHVDYIVTDSPIALGILYAQSTKHYNEDVLRKFTVDLFNTYDNINFLLERNENYQYMQNGRYQNEDEALEKDQESKKLLTENGIKYYTIKVDNTSVEKILEIIEKGKNA